MAEGPGIMTADRFAALAAAYGSEVENWPPQDRVDGSRFALREQGRAILDMARRLDLALGRIAERWGPGWSNSRQEQGGIGRSVLSRGSQAARMKRGRLRSGQSLPTGGDRHG